MRVFTLLLIHYDVPDKEYRALVKMIDQDSAYG